MSITDMIALNIYAIKPLLPCIFVIVVATVAMFSFILIKSKGIWFGKKNFEQFGLFVELHSSLALKLACLWIKLIVVCYYLLSFTQLEVIHYIFLIVPCIIILIFSFSVMEFITHFFGIVIQFIGVLAANILCSYIMQFEMKISYVFIYVLIAMILILYSVYIFITEVDFVSARRSVKIEKRKQRQEEA